MIGARSLMQELLQRWCMHRAQHIPMLYVAKIECLVMQGVPEEQLALPLLVMLAQQRRFIAVQSQTGPLKLIAELYDKAQESLYLVRRHTWP